MDVCFEAEGAPKRCPFCGGSFVVGQAAPRGAPDGAPRHPMVLHSSTPNCARFERGDFGTFLREAAGAPSIH